MENNFKTGEFDPIKNRQEQQTVQETQPVHTESIEADNSTQVADEYVIGSGFSIEQPKNDDAQNKSQKQKAMRKKRRKKGVLRTFIWLIAILAVSAGIAMGAIFGVIDYMGLRASKSITITIEKGEALETITDELHDKGAVQFPFLFNLYAGKKGYYEKFTSGVHNLTTDMGYAALVNELSTVEGFTSETVTVSIPEMATVDSIAKLLEDNGVCSKVDFYDAVQNSKFDFDFIKDIPTKSVHYRLEGYLYPDKYEFYKWHSKAGAEAAITKMLENFQSKLPENIADKAKKRGYSVHEILSMASVIELECNGYYKEMPKVAAVFYSRLEDWGDEPRLLGSSPTANYPYGDNYNTNKTEGLPPGPLCSMGNKAIEAALEPDMDMKGKYFYFVTDTDFNFYYTKTYEEHNSVISSLQAQGKWGED